MNRVLLCLLLSFVSFVLHAQIQFKHFDTESGLPNNSSSAILRDSYGFLWVGTYDGLSKYDGTNFQNYLIIDSTNGAIVVPVFKLLEDSKRRIWIGTNRGLSYYDRKRDNFVSVLRNVCVSDIDESVEEGILWISTFSGLLKINFENGSVLKTYNDSNKLPSNITSECQIDSKGILWVAMQNDGLFSFNPKTEKIQRYIHDPKNSYSIPSNRIKTIAFDKNGKLWIGTYNAGLCVYDTAQKQFRKCDTKIIDKKNTTSDFIESILVDSKNDVWFCHNGCLSQYIRKTDKFAVYPAENYYDRFLNSYNLSFITEDYYGTFWFGTFGSGIYCWNKKMNNFNFFNHVPENYDGLKSDGINCFYELNGKVIIGTNGGLQNYDPKTNKFSEFNNPTLNSVGVNSLTRIDDDLWCTTWGQGIFRLNLKTNKLSHFTHENNNPNSISTNILKIVTKIEDKFWIATWGDGIEAYDCDCKSVISHETLTNNSKDFTKPSWVSKILLDSKHRIWITTMYGVYMKQGKSFQTFQQACFLTGFCHISAHL